QQQTVVGVGRVVVPGERERVVGVEPASTGTEAVTDDSEPVTELGSDGLTAAGGHSTIVPLAAGGGAAVLVAGLGFLLVKRRRKRA
ncbi:LPXTG cell wall anchor domain-containing protein, partial [Micromonospora zamorensis]|uniref:LPXTG cell wall anchor domain-containing protein n=1 Tax=Micromonospora zamorensis TaxID=709883 RepID=UPI00340BD9CC